jgi:hypothetical protein
MSGLITALGKRRGWRTPEVPFPCCAWLMRWEEKKGKI